MDTLALQEMSFLSGDEGEYWCWGHAGYGQLGLGKADRSRITPTHVSSLRGVRIVQIASGFRHTVFLSDHGDVYVCGANSFGQLGLGDTANRHTPTKLPLKAVFVACGLQHTGLITESGRAYMCGMDNRGQSGRSGPGHTLLPVEGIDEPVSLIALGQDHSVLLTKSNKLYTCGRGSEGELGNEAIHQDYTSARIVPFASPSPIISIAAGICFSLALAAGRVYSWGKNDVGQCGLLNSGEGVLSPTPIRFLDDKNIVNICCGWHHAVALTAEGQVYIWGGNSDGQCGVGYTSVSVAPRLLSALSGQVICHLSLGSSFSVAVNDIGNVLTWGSNYNYQIGHDENRGMEMLPRLALSDKNLTTVVTAGGEGVIAMVSCTTPLGSDIGSLLRSSESPLSDVKFVFDTRCIYAHQIILRSRSPAFQAQFLFKSKTVTIPVNEWSFDAFHAMLSFMYTDHLPPESIVNCADEVQKLAIAYTLPRLAALARRITNSQISPLPISSLALDLQAALSSEDFADVVFSTSDDRLIYAHKCILQCRGGLEFAQSVGISISSSPIMSDRLYPMTPMTAANASGLVENIESLAWSIEPSNAVDGAAAAVEEPPVSTNSIARPVSPSQMPRMRASSLPYFAPTHPEPHQLLPPSFLRGQTLPAMIASPIDAAEQKLCHFKEPISSQSSLVHLKSTSNPSVELIKISDDITPFSFQRVILYLYTGDLTSGIDEKTAFEVMVAAGRLGVTRLQAACSYICQQMVTFENVSYYFQVGKLTSDVRLKQFCMHYLLNSYERIRDMEFIGLLPEDIEELQARRELEMAEASHEEEEEPRTSLALRLRRRLRISIPKWGTARAHRSKSFHS